ncbi:hypothetical protein TrRE_jg992 [Triparma retinervis]|uniref:Uncharacterized protein n=1 Tax=Triparma retinervis TaxID=2557542 RepID=A0A9W7DTU6_9STRA|nr:hypothetical protein TrRE_jg992 [Triparma retinervis]
MLLRRPEKGGAVEVVDLALTGEQRLNTLEFILSPKYEHILVPFTTASSPTPTPFRVCFYTARPISVASEASQSHFGGLGDQVFGGLLDLPPPPGRPHEHHALGPSVVLVVVKMKASVFFAVVNGGELDVCETMLRGAVANGGDALSLHYEFVCDVKLGGGSGANVVNSFERSISENGRKLCRRVSDPEITLFGVGQGDVLQIVGARGG